MKGESPIFFALTGIKGLYTAQIGKLRCTAYRLRDGSLLLYSPVAGLGCVAQESLSKLGDVSFLLAPNHYHNRGLSEYLKTFPNANLICSTSALPRLSRVTELKFGGLENLEGYLPANAQILEPDGLKTGEMWLQIKSKDDVIWIVADAFTAQPTSAGVFTQKPLLLGTFPKYGVQDSELFKCWVETTISNLPPTIVIPCHGGILKCSNLGKSLSKLLRKTL
jgi:hypothetical protein